MESDSSSAPTQILVIDQSKPVRWTAAKVLGQDYVVHEASDGKAGWDILQQNKNISLVYTALQMPLLDGCQLLKLIRSADDTRLINIPVIVITGADDDQEHRERVLNLGATDFIAKPFDSLTLRSRTQTYAGFSQRLAELQGEAEIDLVNGLSTKASFQRHGEQAVSLATRHKTDLTVAMLHIAHFDALRAKIGTERAAQLLTDVAKELRHQLRTEDLATRLDGPRFGLLLPLTNRVGARLAIERVCKHIAALGVALEGHTEALQIGAGLACIDRQFQTSFHNLSLQAEFALNQAAERDSPCILSYADNVVRHQAGKDAQEHAGTAIDEAVAVDLTRLLSQLTKQPDQPLDPDTLALALDQLWPLLIQADHDLGLGMQLALRGAKRALDSLRNKQPDDNRSHAERREI